MWCSICDKRIVLVITFLNLNLFCAFPYFGLSIGSLCDLSAFENRLLCFFAIDIVGLQSVSGVWWLVRLYNNFLSSTCMWVEQLTWTFYLIYTYIYLKILLMYLMIILLVAVDAVQRKFQNVILKRNKHMWLVSTKNRKIIDWYHLCICCSSTFGNYTIPYIFMSKSCIFYKLVSP